MYQFLVFTVQKLFARLKFQTELQYDRTKTTCPESAISGAQRYRELTLRYGWTDGQNLSDIGRQTERERERDRERAREKTVNIIHR